MFGRKLLDTSVPCQWVLRTTRPNQKGASMTQRAMREQLRPSVMRPLQAHLSVMQRSARGAGRPPRKRKGPCVPKSSEGQGPPMGLGVTEW